MNNKERKDTTVRLAVNVKANLDEARGATSVSEYIRLMLEYFQFNGVNPRNRIIKQKEPILEVGKRIEDVIKILKCQERDLLIPMSRTIGGDVAEVQAKLVTESIELKKQLKNLESKKNDLEKELQNNKDKIGKVKAILYNKITKGDYYKTIFYKPYVTKEFLDNLVKEINNVLQNS